MKQTSARTPAPTHPPTTARRVDTHLQVSQQEAVDSRYRQSELQSVCHRRLHLQDLLLVVRAVGDEYQVSDFRRVNLLILGCEQHRRNPHKLQVLTRHLRLGKMVKHKT